MRCAHFKNLKTFIFTFACVNFLWFCTTQCKRSGGWHAAISLVPRQEGGGRQELEKEALEVSTPPQTTSFPRIRCSPAALNATIRPQSERTKSVGRKVQSEKWLGTESERQRVQCAKSHFAEDILRHSE
jgi:hypothetical protein